MYLEALQNIQFHIFMSANLTVNQSTLQFVLRTLHKKKKNLTARGKRKQFQTWTHKQLSVEVIILHSFEDITYTMSETKPTLKFL